MSHDPQKNTLVWIDLEMTGLEPQRHVIVEVSAVVTDSDLNVLGEGIDLVVSATEEELAEMDDFVTTMHTTSGLLDAIRSSTLSIHDAEDAVLALMEQYCDPSQQPHLAGNSIGTDRMFIKKYMPRLDDALHYRMVDVSTIKELMRRWFPRVYYGQPAKGMAHRALADIIESIRELDYYRRCAFWQEPGPSSTTVAKAGEQSTARYLPLLDIPSA